MSNAGRNEEGIEMRIDGKTGRAEAGGVPIGLACGLLLVTACSDEDGRVKDAPLAQVDTVAVALIGDEAEDPLRRVVGGLILEGGIVIADDSTLTLRFYSRGGELVSVRGGQGDGPGRFRSLWWLQEAGGRLFAYDIRASRISEFDQDGTFVRSVRLNQSGRFIPEEALGVFSDRSFLVKGFLRGVPPRLFDSAGGVSRDIRLLLRYDREGGFADSLGFYEDSEFFYDPVPGRGWLQFVPPLGRGSHVIVAGERYYVMENETPAIDVFRADGARVRGPSFAVGDDPEAVGREDVGIARSRFPASRRDVFDRMPVPEKLPVYGWAHYGRLAPMRARESGEIWMLDYGGLQDMRPVWTVVAEDGTVKGRVTAPEEVEVLDATHDLALVLTWDQNAMKTVELRRILWPSTSLAGSDQSSPPVQ